MSLTTNEPVIGIASPEPRSNINAVEPDTKNESSPNTKVVSASSRCYYPRALKQAVIQAVKRGQKCEDVAKDLG